MKITAIEVLGQKLNTAFIRVKTDGGITGIGATSAPPPVIEARSSSEKKRRLPPSNLSFSHDNLRV